MDLIRKLLMFQELLAAWQHLTGALCADPQQHTILGPCQDPAQGSGQCGALLAPELCYRHGTKNHMACLHQKRLRWGMNNAAGEREGTEGRKTILV